MRCECTWTLSCISASSGAKGKKTAVKPGDPPPEKKLPFAAKMYDNDKRFPDHTERLVFAKRHKFRGFLGDGAVARCNESAKTLQRCEFRANVHSQRS